MQSDWSGIVALAFNWQSLLAGLVGFLAAIAAVVFTLLAENRKAKRELRALKGALGSEIRQFSKLALETHLRCRDCLTTNRPMPFQQIEDAARFPNPVIYLSSANKLGLIGDEAHYVVYFFGLIDVFRGTVGPMRLNQRLKNDIGRDNLLAAAAGLLTACQVAADLLRRFKSRYFENADDRFKRSVLEAATVWKDLKL